MQMVLTMCVRVFEIHLYRRLRRYTGDYICRLYLNVDTVRAIETTNGESLSFF